MKKMMLAAVAATLCAATSAHADPARAARDVADSTGRHIDHAARATGHALVRGGREVGHAAMTTERHVAHGVRHVAHVRRHHRHSYR